ncbi:MAG: DUF1499 domain-containing protein [Ahrensia sp.]
MRMLFNILAVMAVAIIIAASTFVLFGRERTWTAIAGPADLGALDLTTVERTQKPHDALLCSQGLCDAVTVDQTLSTYDVSPAELIAALDAAATTVTHHVQRVDDGTDATKARYVARSNLMRFPDTIWLQAVTMDDGRTGLIAYARAQLGYSDLGVNKARLEGWIAQASLD